MMIKNTEIPDIQTLIRLALETGFSYASELDMDSLVFRQEVRDMCAEDLCRHYGRSWSCPPATGSLESVRERSMRYRSGLIVQTSGCIPDAFDIDAIHQIMKDHCRYFDTLVRQIRMIYHDCLPMGAGSCTRCRRCTYPDRPCRYPGKLYPSMEAYGLLVSEVCLSSGLKYNYGEHTMTFTSCVLLDR